MPHLNFCSRRSPVVCSSACVASSQPLATNIGLDILKNGGNAADAAVAVAAALNVTEPCSTGIGGDCFCLYYDASTKQVHGLNGSGRSPQALTLELLKDHGFSEANRPPPLHAHNVTVPGAAAGWCDAVALHGSKKLSMRQILQPAIDLAEKGFPVSEIASYCWKKNAHALQAPGNPHGKDLLIDGQAPDHGQVFCNPLLADTFKFPIQIIFFFQELAEFGKRGFYEGRVAKAVVDVIQSNGGVMDLEDLKSHATEKVKPIVTNYKGLNVWEIPPNGQGITALLALNILENFNLKEMGHNTAHYLHILIEAVKVSFADTLWFCADPEKVAVPTTKLLSKPYARDRSKLIDLQRATAKYNQGNPFPVGSDTVYFTVVDTQGNACSFINSNYMGFGTGLVPDGCGFTLQNRGANFSLQPGHPNCLAPRKRPYHTIIPALATDADSGELLCSFGVMGGFMQPQGHVQVLLNMLEFGMNPQQALDVPRFCVEYDKKVDAWLVSLEDGIPQHITEALIAKGHRVMAPVTGHNRSMFGRGQIITKGDWWRHWRILPSSSNVFWAGSDPRADGCALGY
ncbi:glutathione hydrolase-like YwrD proenzyme isoform X3 [Podarcis raffonei]|uniref:glutathione hydrolase-like YwrD proenzyme isoform X3 n=1 Tax=Podarcis raffonei TaxID=65483 RepID=UPI00232982F8|nr:glutathione hydrolase-like YwrD proenzyme isoform X3 [Podarcis raffonei]